MLNSVSEFQGWSVAEALRRVADRGLVMDYIAKCRAARNVNQVIEGDHGVSLASTAAAAASVECQLARSLLFEQLHRYIINRRLIIWGRIGHPDAMLAPIPYELVQKVCFNEVPSKVDSQALCGAVRVFDIRIFPVLRAPNVAEFVGRISLRDAFINLVLGDPQVECLGRAASKRIPASMSHLVNDYRGRHYWSLDPDIVCVHASYPDESGEYYYYFGEPGRLGVQVIGCRFQALLELLQSEVYLAEGDPTRPNGSQYILPAIWSHNAFFIDDRTGDLLEDAVGKADESKITHFADGRQYYEIRWRAVMLTPSRHAGNATQYHQGTLLGPQKPPATRIPTKAPTLAKCTAWLELEMRSNLSYRPKRKQDFLVEAQSKWPDLSQRKFDRLWEKSIESTGAHAWSDAGAPKRSKQSPR